MATSAAVAALLSPRALPVLGAGGATRGLGQRSLLSQRADAWFFWRQEVEWGWGCKRQQRVFPTQSHSPWSWGTPLPVSGTSGWGQADIVAATQAALLLTGTLAIVPALGSAVVTGEQPSTDWAESVLPCRHGVEWLQCRCLETQPWGPGHVGLSNLWGGSQPPHLGCLPHSAGCTAGDSTRGLGDSPGPGGIPTGAAVAVEWLGQGWCPLHRGAG